MGSKQAGPESVVHMPKGSTKTRFDNIAKEGAKVTIEEVNYDDCVRMAAAEAEATRTVSLFRIPHGKATRRFRHGSCRATEAWLARLLSSYARFL